MLKNCGCCNVEYKTYDSRSKFCSKSCAAKVNNSKSPKRKKKGYTCKFCSCKIESSTFREVCNSCLEQKKHIKHLSEKLKDLTIRQVKEQHKTPTRPWTDRVRGYARSWEPSKGKSCSKCGYDKHVEICHIKAIVDFPDTATIREVNSLSNLMYLCPNCHWEHDNL